jgi:DNA repair exonuclease SbcCD ATPase subunit
MVILSIYTDYISTLRRDAERKVELEKIVEELTERYNKLSTEYTDFLEALSVISSISDTTTSEVLDYITGVVNKALAELFRYDTRRIQLEKTLYRDTYTHINVVLRDGENHVRSLTLQSGTGLRQTVSFLYVLALIEVRKGRPLFLMDELLSGLHPEAKAVIMEIVKIFAEEGFQFIMCEYGANDIGKVYLVEKPGNVAFVNPWGDEPYDGSVFKYHVPSNYVKLTEKYNKEQESLYTDSQKEVTVNA